VNEWIKVISGNGKILFDNGEIIYEVY